MVFPEHTASVLQTDYFEGILSSMDTAVVATDENFLVRYCNRKAEALFGFSAAEAVGQPAKKLLHFIYPASARQEAQEQLVSKGCWKGRLLYKNQLGQLRLLAISATVLLNKTGQTMGYVAHHCDMAAQREMEQVNEMLYKTRQLFETFMENSPILAWITDATGIFRYLNPAYLQTFHINKEIVGKAVMEVFPESIAQHFLENDEKVLHSGEILRTAEKAITHDGSEHIYEVIKFPIVTPEENMVGGWAIDITEETELRKTADSRLEKLKTSEKEKKTIQARELQLNDMKSRFVTMASHEFRTPLSTILSSVHLLEKYTTAEQQGNRMKHAGKIKESVHHIDSLLEDFLSIGRLQEGKISLYPGVVSLKGVIGETISSLELLKKTGQEIIVLQSGEDTLITDRKLLKNIISNLLSNALKFSGEGKKIEVSTANTDTGVTIVVKDQGIGISKSDQAHLFETFYRARNVQNVQGTGLGLHIVKQYVQMLQGGIQVESEINVGTTVTVSLPHSL